MPLRFVKRDFNIPHKLTLKELKPGMTVMDIWSNALLVIKVEVAEYSVTGEFYNFEKGGIECRIVWESDSSEYALRDNTYYTIEIEVTAMLPGGMEKI